MIVISAQSFFVSAEGRPLGEKKGAGFLRLMGLRPEGCGGGFAASKKGAAGAAGCVAGFRGFSLPLLSHRLRGGKGTGVTPANWIRRGTLET